MAATLQRNVTAPSPLLDWGITDDRIEEAVRRIVEAANPLRVIAFGSWARGEHTPESDLDLAVILDEQSKITSASKLYPLMRGISMSMDILAPAVEHHERFSASVNSVHHDIKTEGVVLYERDRNGPASRLDAA